VPAREANLFRKCPSVVHISLIAERVCPAGCWSPFGSPEVAGRFCLANRPSSPCLLSRGGFAPHARMRHRTAVLPRSWFACRSRLDCLTIYGACDRFQFVRQICAASSLSRLQSVLRSTGLSRMSHDALAVRHSRDCLLRIWLFAAALVGSRSLPRTAPIVFDKVSLAGRFCLASTLFAVTRRLSRGLVAPQEQKRLSATTSPGSFARHCIVPHHFGRCATGALVGPVCSSGLEAFNTTNFEELICSAPYCSLSRTDGIAELDWQTSIHSLAQQHRRLP